MEEETGVKLNQIIGTLENKSVLKQKIYSNTFDVFTKLKDILHEMSGQMNDVLTNTRLIKVEYRDRGKFEAQIQVAGDILIFTMHTNVFRFNNEHKIWNHAYIRSDWKNAYCGVINIYNFLADSFKYNRSTDEGYLIGRIFVNHENCFYVEGKRQTEYTAEKYGEAVIDEKYLTDILETSILYALDFDLLVPAYDTVKIVEVEQMNTKIENSKIQTGKRLGYDFNSDDI